MSEWIDVIEESALENGEHVVVDVDGTEVAVFKIDGEYYAIEDVCTHDGAEIASGVIDGCEIVCPRHGARFCIKTGAVKAPPAYEDINTYKVRIENGLLQLQNS
ncbi:MAG: non-heme iron oxygenase ferredoxin subunit [Methylococcales bacterium]|nr:non-heme iron oxygenase ferredoxin subunit [Methylococcaceae bacterium]